MTKIRPRTTFLRGQMMIGLIRRLLDKGWTHRNPYSAHARKMMHLERLDRDFPWLKHSPRQWSGR